MSSWPWVPSANAMSGTWKGHSRCVQCKWMDKWEKITSLPKYRDSPAPFQLAVFNRPWTVHRVYHFQDPPHLSPLLAGQWTPDRAFQWTTSLPLARAKINPYSGLLFSSLLAEWGPERPRCERKHFDFPEPFFTCRLPTIRAEKITKQESWWGGGWNTKGR
jgi:hypothetical protein